MNNIFLFIFVCFKNLPELLFEISTLENIFDIENFFISVFHLLFRFSRNNYILAKVNYFKISIKILGDSKNSNLFIKCKLKLNATANRKDFTNYMFKFILNLFLIESNKVLIFFSIVYIRIYYHEIFNFPIF